MGEFKVAVEKDYLVFAAGHFITYGGTCETLHGHNYRARVELEGELDENLYVWDFVALKRLMRRLVDELDHKMLLPENNPALAVAEEKGSVRVTYKDRLYVFPRTDVAFVPVPNTTAEMLAKYLAGRVKAEILPAPNVSALSVEVEESFGQSGWYRERLR